MPYRLLTQRRFPWGRACLRFPGPVGLVFSSLCSLAGPQPGSFTCWCSSARVKQSRNVLCLPYIDHIHQPLEPSLPPLNVLKSTPLAISLGLSLLSISSRMSQAPSSQAPLEPHHFINEKPQNTLFSSWDIRLSARQMRKLLIPSFSWQNEASSRWCLGSGFPLTVILCPQASAEA